MEEEEFAIRQETPSPLFFIAAAAAAALTQTL